MAEKMTFSDRLAHAWNAFTAKPSTIEPFEPMSQLRRGHGSVFGVTPEQHIIASLKNRIALDVAAVGFSHSRVNENGTFLEKIDSPLNYCLTQEANLDQTARAFVMDIVHSMFDEGAVAVVPVDTDISPSETGAFDILTMRVGRITAWYADSVRVDLYNERTGQHSEVVVKKRNAAIVVNPFYEVMNEPNSTLKRLVSKLALLDKMDSRVSSGKLDLIFQLPYQVKTETRRQQAEKRRADLEDQLANSAYGIAYADATERITQLNRPAENTLFNQVQYLTERLYSEFGVSKAIFDGTADEATTINYYNSTIEPILAAIADAMTVRFLSKKARTMGQKILYRRDPFKVVAVTTIAEMADKFTRNEILTSNEIRGIVGFTPSSDPKADELRNKNLPVESTDPESEATLQNGT